MHKNMNKYKQVKLTGNLRIYTISTLFYFNSIFLTPKEEEARGSLGFCQITITGGKTHKNQREYRDKQAYMQNK